VTKEMAGMYRDFVRDALVEAAIDHATRLAKHFGNDPEAERAWSVAMALKGLRRSEVVERLDAERMARARA
jgi:hypothetical protein